MKAVVFEYNLARLGFAIMAGKITPQGYLSQLGPTRLKEIPEPTLLADDWCIVRTTLCGICGSDTKQIFIDAQFDNPLTSLVTFPDVPGHEVVGVIEKIGPGVKNRHVGERVLLNPWLSCVPRGINPPCQACQHGLYFVCEHFSDGHLPSGMHTGNCRAATGGFAPYLPAHESQLFPIPDEITFEDAVLADPFSVSFHAILKAPPSAGGTAVVYGCGTLGMLQIAALHSLYPKTAIIAIARHPRQETMAYELGAELVIRTRDPQELIETIAKRTGVKVQRPWYGKPWLLGGVDVIYDTVGSPETIEIGLRIARPRASIVITGVAKAARFEWTPLYFKEIALIGSNAFGVEEFEGERRHAMQIYLRLLEQKRVILPDMITHRFRLEQYRQALLVSHDKDRHQAIKVVFEFN